MKRTWSDIEVVETPDPDALLAEEARVEIGVLDLDFSLRLAEAVFELAPSPVVLRVDSPTICVFQGAQSGTNRFNDVAVIRKNETVLALGHSTFWWNALLASRGTTAAQHPLVDHDRYTDIPGGFPLRNGDHLLGAAAVSGLTAAEDHALLVAGLEDVQV